MTFDMNKEYDEASRNLLESLLSKSYEVEEKVEPIQAYYEPPLLEEAEEFALFDEEDRDILMHRDTHFSSNFDLMIEHYEEGGIGACLDASVERIRFLQDLERKLDRNLAPFLLQGHDAEKIRESRRLYIALREHLERPKVDPVLGPIAELILDEEEPDARAKKAVISGPKIVPALIQLIETPLFYDPLFPGYGQAPIAAILALGMLKAESAIKPLFSLIGSDSFDVESASLHALAAIGEPAKKFCMEQLKARPITKNNERAAIMAGRLAIDPELLLSQLEDPEVQRLNSLATYLVLAIDSLPPHLLSRFQACVPYLPSQASEEIKKILGK